MKHGRKIFSLYHWLSFCYFLSIKIELKAANWDWDKVHQNSQCRLTLQGQKNAILVHALKANGSEEENVCGFMLQNSGGWDLLTFCSDGFHWSYILQSQTAAAKINLKLCGGVSKTKGFEESPCVQFKGDLSKYKALALRVDTYASGHSLQLKSTEEQKNYIKAIGSRARPHCFEDLEPFSSIDWNDIPIGQSIPQLERETPQELRCTLTRCQGKGCGCEYLANNWLKIASCEGHQWSYILEKNRVRLLCKGINALGGAVEEPCKKFTGNLLEYSRCSSSAMRRSPN